MRIRNFYRSRSDLDKMQGVRKFLVPIVTKMYNGEVEGAQRIKESSLPLLTLFNSMETILSELCGREYPELGVAELWDSLRYRSRNPRTEHRLLRFLDFNYYDYHVNRPQEATVIFGAVYFVMSSEHPELRCCLEAVKSKAVYGAEALPYFNPFDRKPSSDDGPDRGKDSDYDPRQDVILELKLRAEQAMNELSSSKPPEGYVSIDALLYATENYFFKDGEGILNALEYVVSRSNGSELDRIRSTRRALEQRNEERRAKSGDKDKGMTTGQQVIFFYYLFDSLGVNFGNSDKAAWIRLIQSVTGRSRDNIKDRLYFKFEELQTQKDLRIVSGCMRELFPSISAKIERDSR